MSRTFLIVLLATVASQAQETNQICSCDTPQDVQDNKDLWLFLKKLSVDVSDDMKELYSVAPGNLYQFDCSHCEEKMRKKRKIMPDPVESSSDYDSSSDSDDSSEHIVYTHDKMCAKGYVKIARYFCVPKSQVDDVNGW